MTKPKVTPTPITIQTEGIAQSDAVNFPSTEEQQSMDEIENGFVAGFMLAAEIYSPLNVEVKHSKDLAMRYVHILRTARIGKGGYLEKAT